MNPDKRPKKRVYYWIFSFALAMLVAGGFAIAATLLTQTTPVIAAASISSPSCPNPTSLTANVSSYIVGITTYVRFTCTADGFAFKESGAITTTPTFTLPTGATQLWVFRSTTGTGGVCSAGTSAAQLTSGTPRTFPAGSNLGWDYCMIISNSATGDMTSFLIVWSG